MKYGELEKKYLVDNALESDPLSISNTISKFLPVERYEKVELIEEYRPDLLAFNKINNKDEWWILFLVNDIIDPFEELVLDKIIKIPIRDNLEALMSELQFRNK